MSATHHRRGFIDHIEETFIAITLGLMTIITFANVIARYVFNSNILWALETTVYLFAWLVLIGASYCVKINAHLGVDVLVQHVAPGLKRALTLFAAACCIIFSVLLFYGSWNYWAPFAGLPPIPSLYNDLIASPLGLPELNSKWRDQAWYETNDVPMLDFLRFIEGPMNEGEAYEKLPRFVPYFALPLGLLLLMIRFVQAGLRIHAGTQDLLVASHEAEDDIDAAAEAANAPITAEGRDPRAAGDRTGGR